MPLSTIHRIRFLPAQGWLQPINSPAQTESFFSIEPVEAGILRLSIQTPGPHGTSVVLSRNARYEGVFPQDFYRWWMPSTKEDEDIAAFLQSWSKVDAMSIVTDTSSCLFDAGGHGLRLQPADQPRLLYGDPRRMGLDSDPTFEVEVAGLAESIGFLRGKGKPSNSTQVDVFIHNSMPIRANGVDLGHLRVLTLKRVDTQARVDLVARCSPMLLESAGLRFSMVPLLHNLQTIPEKTADVVRIGFDLDELVCWVGFFNKDCGLLSWKSDPLLQAMTAKTAAQH